MKAWVLADSRSGYVWNWKLYAGKEDTADMSVGLATRVGLELAHDLEKKGYHLYCDNYYSSPELFTELYKKGTGACGTARINKKGMLLDFQKANLKKGQVITFTDGPLMCLKWMDKRAVVMLSTILDDSMIDKRRRNREASGGVEVVSKPKVVECYNTYMNGVDKGDQLIQYYGYSHRTIKWYKRVFFHLLEVTIVNAYIIYCTTRPPKERLSHLDFHIAVASHLLMSNTRTPSARTVNYVTECPQRLTGRHFLEARTSSKPDCKVCSNCNARKRKQTSYFCKQCGVPMCPTVCFERYHTLVNYKL